MSHKQSRMYLIYLHWSTDHMTLTFL